MDNLQSFNTLVEQFARLPGIGRKTAQRLAYYVLRMPVEEVKRFARDMYDARMRVRYCKVCGMLTDSEVCHVCGDAKRDASTICVVRDSKDAFAFEKTREYRGAYHVLGGTISPLEGIGPDDIAIQPLLARIGSGGVKEVILATNPDVQGEATAAYIASLLAHFDGITVSRIAHGVPVGAELEYADEVTLLKALEGRRRL
jgi:recombination protein RecR